MVKSKIAVRARLTACLLIAVLMLLGVGSAAAQGAPSRTLRVAFTELPGVSETDQYGNRSGLMIDYLNEIAKYTGWAYEYVDADPMALIDSFVAGEYDLMGAAFYSPGFEAYFGYPEYNMGWSSGLLLGRRDDGSLQSYNLASLNGKRIGVYSRATEKISYLTEFLEANDLDCELVYYSFEDMSADGNLYEKLRSGEVDMLLANEAELGGEFRMVATFPAQPYYIVTKADDAATLAELNEALAHIMESTPTFANEAYQRSFPDLQTADVQLNEREQAYVESQQTIIVAVPRSWHPMYCIDNSRDYHDGLIPEVLAQVSEFSGLEFSYIYADTYAESIRLVQEGDADILGAYLGEAEEAFADGISLSRSYVELSSIVLKHKAVDFPSADLTCGVLEGRRLPSDLEAAEVRAYGTVHDMLEAVNDREVDYVFGISALMEQEIQVELHANLVPVSQSGETTSVSFGVPQPVQPELLTILNKSIASISSDERTAMLNRNLVSMGYSSLSLRDVIYDNPFAFTVVMILIVAVVLTIVLLMARNRMRNVVMESRLKAAEAKSLAKSEFLSRMSHEIRTPMNAIVGLADLTCMESDVAPGVAANLEKIRKSSRYLLALINDILDMSRIENGKLELEQRSFSLSEVLDDLEEMMGTHAEQSGLHFRAERQIDHDLLVGDPVRLRQILTNLLSNAIKFTPDDGTVTLEVTELSCDEQGAEFRFAVTDTGIGIAAEDQERIFASFEQISPSTSRSVGTGLGLPISRSMAQLMGGDLSVQSEPGVGSEFYMCLRLPLGTAEAEQPVSTEPEKSLVGVRALLAEDNDLNAEIAKALLGKLGIEVERAVDGRQAVELFTASEPGRYQVVLMDILMPFKDGYQAAREIRASGRADADLPIIAMTANSFKEDEAEARAAGMDGFVPKPVDINQLVQVLRELQ